MEVSSRSGIQATGKIKIKTYRAGMVKAVTPLLRERKSLRKRGMSPEVVDRAIAAIKEAYFIRTAVESRNLVMDSPNYGLDLIIQRLVGNNTYSLNLLWIEIGTGTTAPTVNDTGLTTPSVRAAVSFQEDYGATDAIVQAYITDANLPNGTYGEVGSFVDGTSTIGTGQLFNHALISPTYTKVSGEDTTIEIDINLTNS
jgi:hypothetical protein